MKTGRNDFTETKIHYLKSGSDLFNLEQKELAAKKQIYGAFSDNLYRKLSQLNDTDSIIVKIGLKIQPQNAPFDKTKHSIEQLQQQSNQYLIRVPLVDKQSFINKYGIVKALLSNKNIAAAYDSTPEVIISKINKKTLHNMYLDNNVVSIEEYFGKKICYTSCGNCTNSKGQVQNKPPCFSTLSVSAYNVYSGAPQMPTNSMGQGVNAATFEDNGLRSQVISCFALGSKLKYYVSGNNNDNEIFHAEQCFRCLTNTAPNANFYHFLGSDYSTQSAMNSIVNNSIQTVSCSEVSVDEETGNIISAANDQSPTYSEMISIDSWAYKPPFPVFCNPTGNGGFCFNPHWACYNSISVGNVQDYNQTHFIQIDTATEFDPQSFCGQCISVPVYGQYVGHCNGGVEQAANLPPQYGTPTLNNPFDCSECTGGPSTPPQVPPQARSDREMPMVVAPGMSPTSYLADPCFINDAGTQSLCGSQGTSYSAPICNGIAACVISADGRMVNWPEKVRAVILATAQNIDFNYWNYQQDGRDGAGVVCGTDAVWLAKNHTTIAGPNNTAAPYGICVGSLTTSFQNQGMQFNISIPNPKPSGHHLRVILTWDSSPSTSNGTNDLSDLDLYMYGNNSGYNSFSYESNVEMVDVPASDLTSGTTYAATVYGSTMRIPSYANVSFIYYALAWTWVKDQAR